VHQISHGVLEDKIDVRGSESEGKMAGYTEHDKIAEMAGIPSASCCR